jgi:hypothetical protein
MELTSRKYFGADAELLPEKMVGPQGFEPWTNGL